jgi:hypothetical protein
MGETRFCQLAVRKSLMSASVLFGFSTMGE